MSAMRTRAKTATGKTASWQTVWDCVPQAQRARMLGVSLKTVSTMSRTKKPSPKLARPATEIRRLLAALCEIMKKDALLEWLGTPNEAFDSLKPIEVIERGEIDRIWQMIYALRSGEPS